MANNSFWQSPFKILHYFRTSPVFELCKRVSQAYFSRVEEPVMAIVILGVVSPHSRRIYIQNLYHYYIRIHFIFALFMRISDMARILSQPLLDGSIVFGCIV